MQPTTSTTRPVSPPAALLDRRRYLRVVRFFAGVFVSVIWWDLVLRRVPGLRGVARRNGLARWVATARRFRRLAIAMGGVLIKLGQFLSIRVDVLPTAVTAELADLQDEVPAEPPEAILAVVQAAFGRPADRVFAWFAPAPQAAASLAQVHRARLPDDQEVVVKVQRPNIGQLVATDLAAIGVAVRWLRWYGPIARRVDLDRLFAEFAQVTTAELDFVAEGKNAEHFAADFADDPGIRLAKVYWDFTTRSVLTLEDVTAIKITDYPAIEAAGINRSEVARRLYDTYLKQIFVTNFVHADPHPGNLFVEPLGDWPPSGAEGAEAGAGPATGRPFRLIFVDFGMVATIPPALRNVLQDYIIGVGLRDAHRIVQSYVAAGVLLPGVDLKRLEAMHETMFKRLAGVRMGQLRDVAFEQAEYFLHEYRDIIQEMPFQFPTDILFVGRAVAILSGMSTSLDPDFDPWAATIPFAEQLAAGELGSGLRRGLADLVSVARVAYGLPTRLDRVLRQMERGDFTIRTALTPEVQRLFRRLERAIDRLAWAVIFAVLLSAGVVLRVVDGPGGLSTAAFITAGVALVWSLTRR